MLVDSNAGLYFLLIRLPRRVRLSVRKKVYSLPAGYYVYTGSAQRYLRQRIHRHCSRKKKKHWHIDYLLDHAVVVAVRIMADVQQKDEPRYAGEWALLADGIPVPKFGAGDSPAVSHLAWFKTRKKITSALLWQTAQPFSDP
jgi:Uri superfamily endonuclease